MINNKWKLICDKVDMALQPIVDINSGEIVAYESLLRNYNEVGFNSIDDFFDTAYEQGVLYAVDIELRSKVLEKLKPLYEKNKSFGLFYNLDNRILDMDDYEHGTTKSLLSFYGYENSFITFEISEKHEFSSFIDAQTVFNTYSDQGFSIALDDFGTGFSGLKMLYYLNPQYIKIDRFFITDILKDKKKRLFVSNIVNMAHQSNIKVLAEGVETEDELNVCKDIGCDLVQGYFIQKPVLDIKQLRFKYDEVSLTNQVMSNFCADIYEANFNLDTLYESASLNSQLINRYIIASSTDQKGVITNVTDAFCKISGYKRSQLVGENHNIVRDPQMPKKVFRKMWERLQKGKIWVGELSNLRSDKQLYFVEATIFPNYSNEGELIGYTSLRKDITHKKLFNNTKNSATLKSV